MKALAAAVVLVAGLLVALDAFDARARAVQSSAPPSGAKPASPSPAPPVLSETDRLKVINASQAVEIATLKLQSAAVDVQRTRAEFDRLVAAVTPTGWQLNDKLEFVKVEK